MADEQAKQEAATHGRRAVSQTKRAGRNATRAAQLAAKPAAQEVTETAKDAANGAVDAAETVAEGTAEAARTVERHAPRLSAKGLAAISGDTGTGFFALSVALYSAAVAYHKFRAAYQGRGRAVN